MSMKMKLLHSLVLVFFAVITLGRSIHYDQAGSVHSVRDTNFLDSSYSLSRAECHSHEGCTPYGADALGRLASRDPKGKAISTKKQKSGKNSDTSRKQTQQQNKSGYNNLNWSKSGHDYVKNNPATSHSHQTTEKAAKAAIKQNTRNGNFPKGGDYSIR